MKNLLFTNMIAMSAALPETSSEVANAMIDNSGKILGGFFGFTSIIFIIMSIIPFVIFVMAFSIIIKTMKTQSNMRKEMGNLTNKVNKKDLYDKVNIEKEIKKTAKTTSPINNDPNAVIDLDNVLDSYNTDPIKKG